MKPYANSFHGTLYEAFDSLPPRVREWLNEVGGDFPDLVFLAENMHHVSRMSEPEIIKTLANIRRWN